jgi:hypothetical protein
MQDVRRRQPLKRRRVPINDRHSRRVPGKDDSLVFKLLGFLLVKIFAVLMFFVREWFRFPGMRYNRLGMLYEY